jgi:hypothetical protein
LAARLSGALVVAGGVILMMVALVLAADQALLGVLACLFIAGLTYLVAYGPERAAVVALIIAFATAPAYRGLQGLSAGIATPTDIFMVVACVLLVPVVITRPLSLPAPYVGGLVGVTLIGLIASLLAPATIFSLFTLVQWLFFLGVVPILIAWWRPSVTTVVTLLWAYVLGQGASTVYAFAKGPTVGNRYQGLSHHTNAFGMAGMTAFAILIYLYVHHRSKLARTIVLAGMVGSIASVVMSGSRAAVVVAIVLVLMIPVIERSAVSGFVLAVFGAFGLIAFPILLQTGHAGSALTRLAGDSTAQVADQARNLGLDEGFRRLHESPIIGSGLSDVEVIHNVFLEVAAGIGLFGLFAYLVVLFMFSRPLVGVHPHRRLCYLPVAWIGMGPALPSIYDRTMWVPITLSVLAMFPDWPGKTTDDETTEDELTEEPPIPRLSPVVIS